MHMDIIQSFLYSIGRGDFTLYEQRLLLSIANNAQEFVKGRVVTNLSAAKLMLPEIYIVRLKSRDILSDGSNHYEYVRDAARSLASKRIEFWDRTLSMWRSFSIIDNVIYRSRSGELSFTVSSSFLSVLFDFSKGFSKYDINIALQLSSTYTIRLYSIMCNASRPFEYSIENLRYMLNVGDKYKLTADLIRNTLDVAQKELDDKNVNSFRYERIRNGNKVLSVKLIPVKRQAVSNESLIANVGLSYFLNREIQLIMMDSIGFTYKELSAHKVLLKKFCLLPASMDRVRNILQRAKNRNMNKGYVINAIKSEVDQFQDIK